MVIVVSLAEGPFPVGLQESAPPTLGRGHAHRCEGRVLTPLIFPISPLLGITLADGRSKESRAWARPCPAPGGTLPTLKVCFSA